MRTPGLVSSGKTIPIVLLKVTWLREFQVIRKIVEEIAWTVSMNLETAKLRLSNVGRQGPRTHRRFVKRVCGLADRD